MSESFSKVSGIRPRSPSNLFFVTWRALALPGPDCKMSTLSASWVALAVPNMEAVVSSVDSFSYTHTHTHTHTHSHGSRGRGGREGYYA